MMKKSGKSSKGIPGIGGKRAGVELFGKAYPNTVGTSVDDMMGKKASKKKSVFGW